MLVVVLFSAHVQFVAGPLAQEREPVCSQVLERVTRHLVFCFPLELLGTRVLRGSLIVCRSTLVEGLLHLLLGMQVDDSVWVVGSVLLFLLCHPYSVAASASWSRA